MNSDELYDKGWRLSDEPNYEFPDDHQVWYKGNPLSNNCIWLTRSLTIPKINLTYEGKVLMEGWLVRDEVEELYFLLNKIVWKR